MANSQARDGRLGLAYIGGDPVKATSVAVGDFIVVTAKASSSSVFTNYELNKPFFAVKAFTPATGDEVFKIPLYFLGQATGKSLSHSKNTTDVTMDYDSATNNVTDGIVSTSGSISGMFITEKIADTDTGVNILKSRFKSIIQIDKDGAVSKKDANTTEKDIIVFCWNLRNAKVGDLLDIDVVPALITGLSIGGEYGSSQSFDIDFTGNASDENNFEGSELQVEATAAFLAAFKTARPVA